MRNLVFGANFTLAAVLLIMTGRPAQANAVAIYTLNGNVNDSSYTSYNGTVSGTTAYTSSPSGLVFSFNGATSISTTTTDNLGLVNASFTVLADVYLNTVAVDQPIFGGGFPGGDDDLHLIVRNGSPYMGFYGDDTASSTVLSADTWSELAFVFDAVTGTQTIYVNDILDAKSSGHDPFEGSGATATIGSALGEDLNGAIANLETR